jgi:hypothetical protein
MIDPSAVAVDATRKDGRSSLGDWSGRERTDPDEAGWVQRSESARKGLSSPT